MIGSGGLCQGLGVDLYRLHQLNHFGIESEMYLLMSSNKKQPASEVL